MHSTLDVRASGPYEPPCVQVLPQTRLLHLSFSAAGPTRVPSGNLGAKAAALRWHAEREGRQERTLDARAAVKSQACSLAFPPPAFIPWREASFDRRQAHLHKAIKECGAGALASSAPGGTPGTKNLEVLQDRLRAQRDELTQVKYSTLPLGAAADFGKPGVPFKWRCREAGRLVRLAVCVTMYNESGEELSRTLRGIASNLAPLQAMCGIAWEEVVVFLVADGRQTVQKHGARWLQSHGLLDTVAMKERGQAAADAQESVSLHVFERTVEWPDVHCPDASETPRSAWAFPPMQVITAVKEQNGGKLSSHAWFFQAFCPRVHPEFCLLLDAGTMPQPTSIARLIRSMQLRPGVGGAAGEIVADSNCCNIVQWAQAFEYQIAHDFDKTFESACGFISVLPGAFSAYRWVALLGTGTVSPLTAYFKLESAEAGQIDPMVANMYLAEDRILCNELVLQANEAWVLHYECGAQASTDTPATLQALIKQRRRWLNGSLFAQINYIGQFVSRIGATRHPWWRKCVLSLQVLYMACMALVTWFSPGLLFLSLLVVLRAFNAVVGTLISPFFDAFFFAVLYLSCIGTLVLAGMVGDVGDLGALYVGMAMFFGVVAVGSGVMIAVLMVLSADNLHPAVLASAVGATVPYIVAPSLQLRLRSALGTLPAYALLALAYVNMLPINALAQLHDTSWGTRPGRTGSLWLQSAEEREARALRLTKSVMATVEQRIPPTPSVERQRVIAAVSAAVQEEHAAKLRLEQQGQMREAKANRRQKQEAQVFNYFRLWVTLSFMLCNGLLVAVITASGAVYFSGLTIAGIVLLATLGRGVGMFAYSIERWCSWFVRRFCHVPERSGRNAYLCGCRQVDALTGVESMVCASPLGQVASHRWLAAHNLATRDTKVPAPQGNSVEAASCCACLARPEQQASPYVPTPGLEGYTTSPNSGQRAWMRQAVHRGLLPKEPDATMNVVLAPRRTPQRTESATPVGPREGPGGGAGQVPGGTSEEGGGAANAAGVTSAGAAAESSDETGSQPASPHTSIARYTSKSSVGFHREKSRGLAEAISAYTSLRDLRPSGQGRGATLQRFAFDQQTGTWQPVSEGSGM